MSEYQVRGRFNAPLLSEELVAAFPELIVDTADERQAVYALSYDGTTLSFKSRPTIPEKPFFQVIQAHNPNGKSKNERRRDRAQQLAASIRQKLLGLGFTPEEIGFLHEFFSEEGRASTQAITGRPV